MSYEHQLRGVKLPLEILIPELERVGIKEEDIVGYTPDHQLYYSSGGHYYVATGKFDFSFKQQGIIGFYLKQGMEREEAVAKVTMLLAKPRAEMLYGSITLHLVGNRTTKPIYIPTTVAVWKSEIFEQREKA